MKKMTFLASAVVLSVMTGCVPGAGANPYMNNNSVNNQSLGFTTDTSRFMTRLGTSTTQASRNTFLDEFLLQSDMQCQNYLNSPVSTINNNPNEQNLYMNIFDTMSMIFGVKYLTDSAKEVLVNDPSATAENKKAYESALSPEIRRGVELGRSRHAKNITDKKGMSLEAYSMATLQNDLSVYDKQCSNENGLVEINRALREMQSGMHRPTAKAMAINPTAIKNKVAAVTKKVKAKEEKKKEEKKKEEKKREEKKIEEIKKNKDIKKVNKVEPNN